MTRHRAFGILSAAMDGQKPARLDEALRLLGVAETEFERCRRAAHSVTAPMHPRESIARTELAARRIHGLDSDYDYDSVAPGEDVPLDVAS